MTSQVIIKAELHNAFRQAWENLALESAIEPNLSLIAAYVDRRLDEGEIQDLARHFVECPAAWDVMERVLPEGIAFPLLPEAASDSSGAGGSRSVPPHDRPEAKQPGGMSRPVWSLAVAAGWLVALTCGTTAWWWSAKTEDLRRRLAQVGDVQAKLKEVESQQRARAE